MDESHTDDEFKEFGGRERLRLQGIVEKNAFKDGAFDGRQAEFQPSFDGGYADGFRNGQQLGLFQGMLTALAQIDGGVEHKPPGGPSDLLLLKPTRGQCQLCLDKDLINGEVDALRVLQQAHGQKCREALHAKYAHVAMLLEQEEKEEKAKGLE